MRDETCNRFNDLALTEAMHDRVVDAVVALRIDVDGEPVVISNALRYLLYDELRLAPGQVVDLRVVSPMAAKPFPDRPPEEHMAEWPEWADA